jgi:hypothetical protein
MGHMYPNDLSELMVKQIYAKGKASVNQFITKARKDGVVVSCAEGVYDDEYMYEMAFDALLSYHNCEQFLLKGENVTQLMVDDSDLTEDQNWAWGIWLDGAYWDSDTSDEDQNKFWAIWKTIPWKFQKGMRKKYIDKEIHHLDYWCN